MRYVEYRDAIQSELQANLSGLTWAQLQSRLDLPYDRPVSNVDQAVGKRDRIAAQKRAWSFSPVADSQARPHCITSRCCGLAPAKTSMPARGKQING